MWSDKAALSTVVRCLKAGGLIAYPTEAVWGLGCDPTNEQAVHKLLTLKQREVAKGLILVAADLSQLTPYLQGLPPALLNKLTASWPGPMTWLVPDNGTAPPWIKGSHPRVALRVSAHPVVVELCRAFGAPLVSTSANGSGQPPIKRHALLCQTFGSALDIIIDGPLGSADQPTTLRDAVTDEILRP